MEENKELMYLTLMNFSAVGRFRSVRRAIRRGNVAMNGMIIPTRPYHTKANTCKRKGHHSRKINELKRKIYGRIRGIDN